MSWRTTAILFVVVLVLAGLVFIQSRQEPEVEEVPTAQPTLPTVRMFDDIITLDQVTELSVQRIISDTSVLFLHDARGDWYQTFPTQTQVISATLSGQVNNLINLSSRRTFGPNENPLEAYGLDEPQAQISLSYRKDEVVVRATFLVGDLVPGGNGYYFQKQGDPRVHIVPQFNVTGLLDLVGKPPVQLPTPTPVITSTLTITPSLTLTATVPLSTTVPISGTTPTP